MKHLMTNQELSSLACSAASRESAAIDDKYQTDPLCSDSIFVQQTCWPLSTSTVYAIERS